MSQPINLSAISRELDFIKFTIKETMETLLAQVKTIQKNVRSLCTHQWVASADYDRRVYECPICGEVR
jgi:hypothetical protein